MARRKSDDGDSVSLFPLMSILDCLIGSLTLMIAALMANSANSEQSEEVVQRYHDHSKLKAEMEADRKELEQLAKLIADAERLSDEAKRALAEVARLENQQKDKLQQLDANSEYAKMLAEANRLRTRITELEIEPKALQEEIARLKKEVEKRNAGPEEAIVQIRSGGSGVDIVPTFVECASTGLVVHEGQEPQRIRTGDIAKSDGDFAKLLNRVAATPKGQVIFLVRPDAVGVYNTARNFARQHYGPNGFARNGKLPVPTQGNIDLSVFRK